MAALNNPVTTVFNTLNLPTQITAAAAAGERPRGPGHPVPLRQRRPHRPHEPGQLDEPGRGVRPGRDAVDELHLCRHGRGLGPAGQRHQRGGRSEQFHV